MVDREIFFVKKNTVRITVGKKFAFSKVRKLEMARSILCQSVHAYMSWIHAQELLAPPPLASHASAAQQSCHP